MGGKTTSDLCLYNADGAVSHQRESLLSGQIPVSVYGLGKMGLPLAAVFADVTGNVTGVDVDPSVVEAINNGNCHIKREPGLKELVSECVEEGSMRATVNSVEAAERARIHVVIVPTILTDNKEPDLSILDSVIEDIGEGLSSGDLVLIECTVPPRTTVDRVVPLLEEMSGLDKSEFGVAFCPERTSSGRALKDIRGAYPKVIGGVDEQSTQSAKLVYQEINEHGVYSTSDATTAECVKVFEGLYRDVNIALANELARFTDELGIDVNEAIEIANTQPFCDIHDPGPGVGGHCIPFYPYFLIGPFATEAPMLKIARDINDSMPKFTVKKLFEEFAAEGLDPSSTSVLILGLTYRPGVEEIRASPSLDIATMLSEAGVDVYGTDPLLEQFDPFDLTPVPLSDIYEYDFDGLIMVTPHEEFDSLNWHALGRKGGAVVIDGRQTLDLDGTEHRVYTIGSGLDV